MKLKTDASGNAVLQDGKPVYVADDGAELALDAAALYGQVRTLTKEAGAKRKALEAAEAKLAEFGDIEDPSAARSALETVKSLEGKTKADIEKVRAEVSKSYEAKLGEVQAKLQTTEATLQREVVERSFLQSKFVTEKSAIPPSLLLPSLAKNLSYDSGQVVVKRDDGTPIYSRANPGQLAGMDEGLEVLIGERPDRDHIFKATQKSGSGAQPGAQGGASKTMPADAFDRLPPKEQAARMAEGYKLTE